MEIIIPIEQLKLDIKLTGKKISFRFPLGITLRQCHFTILDLPRIHFKFIPMPQTFVLRLSFDCMAYSFRCHCWLTSNSLGFHPHLAISLRFHFGLTSNSLRIHFRFFTPSSLRFHCECFESIAMPLRIHFEFTSMSSRSHFDFT